MSGQTGQVRPSRQVLAEILGVKPEDIKDSSRLGKDLDLGRDDKKSERLAITELWFALEERYDTDIPVKMRPSLSELRDKTAEQFDAHISSLVGNSEPLEDEKSDPSPGCNPGVSGDASV